VYNFEQDGTVGNTLSDDFQPKNINAKYGIRNTKPYPVFRIPYFVFPPARFKNNSLPAFYLPAFPIFAFFQKNRLLREDHGVDVVTDSVAQLVELLTLNQ
jgi:hypothetical protein